MAKPPSLFQKYAQTPLFPKTDASIEKMAYGLMRYLMDNNLFYDTRIYYRHADTWKALQSHKPDIQGYEQVTHAYRNKKYEIYVINDIDPNDYFEYNGSFLSMSFEGQLYYEINDLYDTPGRLPEYLKNYFSHWGLYYEQGHAWNLSVYE